MAINMINTEVSKQVAHSKSQNDILSLYQADRLVNSNRDEFYIAHYHTDFKGIENYPAIMKLDIGLLPSFPSPCLYLIYRALQEIRIAKTRWIRHWPL